MNRNRGGFHKAPEFEKWFNGQAQIDQYHILERFSRIMLYGNFGDYKYIGGIWELRWKNGRRVYYGYLHELDIVVLLGGNKNGQKRDIARAKKIFKKYEEAEK